MPLWSTFQSVTQNWECDPFNFLPFVSPAHTQGKLESPLSILARGWSMCAPVLPCREMHRGNNHYVSKVTRPVILWINYMYLFVCVCLCVWLANTKKGDVCGLTTYLCVICYHCYTTGWNSSLFERWSRGKMYVVCVTFFARLLRWLYHRWQSPAHHSHMLQFTFFKEGPPAIHGVIESCDQVSEEERQLSMIDSTIRCVQYV